MAVSPVSLRACLFFETQAEEAARFYASIFPNSSIDSVTNFSDTGHDIHKNRLGTVMAVDFTLAGTKFLALNSKPSGADMAFNESISFQICCKDQKEVDYFWGKLTEGGDEKKQICGWLKDKYGVHWQVVPKIVDDTMGSSDEAKKTKAMKAVMEMKKIIVQDVADAVEGKD